MLTATVFSTRPVAFAAWTLAAFTISAFLGMLFRRIIAAMAAVHRGRLAVVLSVLLVAAAVWLVRRRAA